MWAGPHHMTVTNYLSLTLFCPLFRNCRFFSLFWMAHWFHRNPIKATQPLKFDSLKKCAKGSKCDELITWEHSLSPSSLSLFPPSLSLSLCLIQYILLFFTVLSQLKVTRQRLLELFNNHANSVEDLTVAFTEYVGLLKGLVDAPNGGDSKLRTLTLFKWTNSLGGRVPR